MAAGRIVLVGWVWGVGVGLGLTGCTTPEADLDPVVTNTTEPGQGAAPGPGSTDPPTSGPADQADGPATDIVATVAVDGGTHTVTLTGTAASQEMRDQIVTAFHPFTVVDRVEVTDTGERFGRVRIQGQAHPPEADVLGQEVVADLVHALRLDANALGLTTITTTTGA